MLEGVLLTTSDKARRAVFCSNGLLAVMAVSMLHMLRQSEYMTSNARNMPVPQKQQVAFFPALCASKSGRLCPEMVQGRVVLRPEPGQCILWQL